MSECGPGMLRSVTDSEPFCGPGKKSWPELVGENGEVAAATIERENKNVHAIVMPVGAAWSLDLVCGRVRIAVDEEGRVIQTPYEGKNSWPELVGENGEVAAATIERENKNVHAILMPEGIPWTQDFMCGRVRVAVDGEGRVIRTPMEG